MSKATEVLSPAAVAAQDLKKQSPDAPVTGLPADPIQWVRLVLLVLIVVGAVSIQVYFFGIPDLTNATSAETGQKLGQKKGPSSRGRSSSAKLCSAEKLWTAEELKPYDGSDEGQPILLALIGEVFDVSKGKKHYGKGGGYNGFTGKDGSRAFVTGTFTPEGLVPDTAGLKHTELNSIHDWLLFYRKDYIVCGKLVGHYYDAKGGPTEARRGWDRDLVAAGKAKKKDEDEKQEWPACNSKWSQNDGRSVWCEELSGGIKRNWAGVPRRMFKQSSNEERCVCVEEKRLSDPRLRLYDGCSPASYICTWDAQGRPVN